MGNRKSTDAATSFLLSSSHPMGRRKDNPFITNPIPARSRSKTNMQGRPEVIFPLRALAANSAVILALPLADRANGCLVIFKRFPKVGKYRVEAALSAQRHVSEPATPIKPPSRLRPGQLHQRLRHRCRHFPPLCYQRAFPWSRPQQDERHHRPWRSPAGGSSISAIPPIAHRTSHPAS